MATPSSPTTDPVGVEVDRNALQAALKTLQPAVDARSSVPLAGAVEIDFEHDYIELRAGANQRLRIVVRLDLQAQLGLEEISLGRLVVSHTSLTKAVSAFKEGALRLIALDSGRLRLVAGRRRITLDGLDSERFADLPAAELFTALAEVDVVDFAETLGILARCAAIDASRPYLQCVALDTDSSGEITLVATDGYRLAARPIRAQVADVAAPQLLVALEGCRALAKTLKSADTNHWLEISFLRSDDELFTRFVHKNGAWIVGSPDGQFPNWRQILGVDGELLEIDYQELAEAIKSIENLFALRQGQPSSSLNAAKLQANQEKGRLRYRDSDVGELIEDLPGMRYLGEEALEIGFNPVFLGDMLRVLDSDSVEGLVVSAEQGVVFRAEDRAYMLMPVRLLT